MAKPKKGVVALQTEVNTEEEWQELLTRPGLILVDVYCGWSGPCAAMVSFLRKIKMEIGGDTISYAIASNDEINDLARFRGSSEPVWMFIQDGKMVNILFGADAPKLRKLLTEEIKRVKEGTAPGWELAIDQRCPEEENKWQKEEAIRKVMEDKKNAEENARKKQEYEAFMAQMTFELCEMMVVVMYPWVFKDEDGNPKIKMQCLPYTELVRDLLRQIFTIQDEIRIEFDEEMIKKMLVESDVELTRERIIGLTDGKAMAIRMKSRPPPSDWPVPYPHTCPASEEKCPVRAINDVENYFHSIIETQSHRKTIVGSLLETPRQSVVGTYLQRFEYIHEPDPEIEDDIFRIDPAIWAPYQARSKVHVFLTLFPEYMAENHPYVVPKPPPPLCAFKYKVKQLEDIRNAFDNYSDTVEYFAVFPIDEPRLLKRIASSLEEFDRKVKKATTEVFVVVMKKVNEEAFLAFAGIDPYFVAEKEEEVQKVIDEYFPEEMDRIESSRSMFEIAEGEEEAEQYYETDVYD